MILYPPVVNASEPAFPSDTKEVKIYFEYPQAVNPDIVTGIQYTVAYQASNKSALDSTDILDDKKIAYVEKSEFDVDDKGQFIVISSDKLKGKEWLSGTIYKVQLRFTQQDLDYYRNLQNQIDDLQKEIKDYKDIIVQKNDILKDKNLTIEQREAINEEIKEYKDKVSQLEIDKANLTNEYNNYYSEWSTVCYLKATAISSQIYVDVLGLEEDDNTSILFVDSPKFMGTYRNDLDPKETEKYYYYELYNAITNELVESTGQLLHTEESIYDEAIFSQLFEDQTTYKLVYGVITKNGYQVEHSYKIICSLNMVDDEGLSVEAIPNYDEAYIKLLITTDNKIASNVVLRRTDSKSDFIYWEDYATFNILDEYMHVEYKDYLVEHGVKYMYGVQLITDEGFRSPLIMTEPICVYYEDAFLVGNNKQLKIKYNPKINNLKRQLQESKVDTIGSKYPFIVRNGAVDYFSFPLGGLISYHMDDQKSFSSLGEENYNFNLDNQNITQEREFRKQVEEFLTNGDYKFFKSPTEGIFLIALTGVSLSPEEALGRMIYSFSSTAYEIGEASLSNCLDFNLVNSGKFVTLEDMGQKTVNGSMIITPSKEIDLFKLIQSEYEQPNKYSRIIDHLTFIQIEVLGSCPFGYKFYLSQTVNPEDSEYVPIIISDNLKYFELKDIDIYGFKLSQADFPIRITYNTSCRYEPNDRLTNYKSVTKLVQYNRLFDKDHLNVFDILKKDEDLTKIINLSYLRIDAQQGTVVMVNGTSMTINDTESLEIREMPVTSLGFAAPAVAQITLVYNGFTKLWGEDIPPLVDQNV